MFIMDQEKKKIEKVIQLTFPSYLQFQAADIHRWKSLRLSKHLEIRSYTAAWIISFEKERP